MLEPLIGMCSTSDTQRSEADSKLYNMASTKDYLRIVITFWHSDLVHMSIGNVRIQTEVTPTIKRTIQQISAIYYITPPSTLW